MRSRLRIGVFGPYSSKNLGDTATQMAVMGQLRARLGDVEFVGICFDPADAARTHGVIAADMTGASGHLFHPGEPAPSPGARGQSRWLPYRAAEFFRRIRVLWNVGRIVRKLDALVISGGGQLDDFWGGPWSRPYELLVWTGLSRLFRRKVAIFGTGVDNLRSPLGIAMIGRATRLAHFRMFRDQETVRMLREWGIENPGPAGPDPAFSLAVGPASAVASPAGRKRVVVICPIAESAWRREPEPHYPAYLDALVEVAVQLERQGAGIILSNSQAGMDIPILDALANRITQRLETSAGVLQVRPCATVAEFCALAASADLVIASRLHGIILPIAVGTPVVAIAYMPKVSLLMLDAGMPDKCVALSQASTSRIAEMATDALANGDELRARIAALNERYRSELSAHYDGMIEAIFGRKPPRPPN